MIKPIFATAILALSAAAFAPSTASAQVGVSIVIGNAPPPPRIETLPAPRRGYVWAPGYWNWDGHRHVWAAGHWEREVVGSSWRQAEWVRDGGGWRFAPGGWVTVGGPGRVDYITVAPPPPRYERIPAPRAGYIWAPGYWDWRGNRHEWVGGSWISFASWLRLPAAAMGAA
ncbi:YXWGXW repeat-containing protein [Duganella sp. P38]|uniref:YXWGXW repeat-containing protein n=1 Tax=Duganella sp. P38 TaxID=3423949 RepID=UPI003D7A2D51